MGKIFWVFVLLAGYFWVVTSGHEGLLLEKGKSIYQSFVAWFDDAEIDLNVKKKSSGKKTRRWD